MNYSKFFCFKFCITLLFFLSNRCLDLKAQFQINKAAFKTSDRCWTLTNDKMFEVGSVWYEKKLDLSESFDLTMSIFLGCRTDGADGIVFGLQPVSTSIGVAGQGIGFQGVVPSIGIEFDTYRNFDFNDPPYDHITLIRDGDLNHNSSRNTIAGPVPIMLSPSTTQKNIKDCKTHDVRFTWDAQLKKFSVYWECTLQLSKTIDLVKEVFNGDPNVYWGFTAATGGSTNVQKICLKYTSLLDRIADTVLCRGGQIQLSAKGGVKYQWIPATGLSDPFIQNPIAKPDKTTQYAVVITDTCGIKFTDTLTVKVGGNPFVLELGNDTSLCTGQNLVLNPHIDGAKISWQDGSTDSIFNVTKSGLYKIVVEKNFCRGTDSIKVKVLDPPRVNLGGDVLLCLGKKKVLSVHADEATYAWQDGTTLPSYVITQSGIYTVGIKNRCGYASDFIVADYQQCHKVFIPNVFSPNGDAQNDTWQIFGGDDLQLIHELKVFNRWGRLIYDATDFFPNAIDGGWDGKNAVNGVYTYFVTVYFNDGLAQSYRGEVTIVR